MSDLCPGDRVEMTEAGIAAGLDGPRRLRTGVALAPSKMPGLVRILRDGCKAPASFARGFWRRAEAEAAPFSPAWLERRARAAAFARE